MRNATLLFFLFLALLSGCKNDLDITDEWREVPVIFGLFNQSDSIQYVKINKAFLGKENAFVMAGNYDTNNYADLEVKINELSNNTVINTYTLQRDTTIAKPSGVFAYPQQVFYKFTAQLNEFNEYELVVTNLQSGHVCRSRTALVHGFSTISPAPSQQINFVVPNTDFHVKFYSAVNGRLYNLNIRFWYTEINKITNLVRQRHIDWVFTDISASRLDGSEILSFDFPGNNFFTMLRSRPELVYNDSLWRHVGKITSSSSQLDFIVTAAGEEFATYMDINKPVDGPLMEKPYYTNIENGIGLFSARFTELSPSFYNKKMTDATIDSIYAGQYTSQLGFCSPNNTSPYNCN